MRILAFLLAVLSGLATASPAAADVRVTSRTYDLLDRLETETVALEDGGLATVRYGYWEDGRRRTVTDAFGRVTFYEYDARGNLARVTANQGLPDQHVTTYEYWPDNLLRSITRPNGTVTSYDYDRADRLTSVFVRLAASVLASYEYTYDANGNRLTQVETNGGPPETTTYSYDSLNRLSTVAYPDGKTFAYEYDAVGNRTRETERNSAGVAVSDKTAVFDAINRLTTVTDAVDPSGSATLAWDRNGNMLSKTTPTGVEEYSYDARDLMAETRAGPSVLARNAYDPFGRRHVKIGLEDLRQYVYDETSTLHELDNDDAEVAKYEYGGDSLLSFVRRDEPRRFYHLDGLGSPTALSDSAGSIVARYHLDAWGRYRSPSELSASANRFGFTGYLFDQETDLYYAKARFYDPEIGRFTSQDSVLGEVDEPPSLHRYLYGYANPLRYLDPSGHAPEDLQAIADREIARVAAIRSQRGSGLFGTNQGQGAGTRPRPQSNDTELQEIAHQLGPDERQRFAEAARKAGLSAAKATITEEGQLSTGDAVVDAALQRQKTLRGLEKIGRVGGAGGRVAVSAMWGHLEDAVILGTGSDFNGEPASRGWAAARLGGSYAVRIGGRVATVTKRTENFADDAAHALADEQQLARAERRVAFGSHGGEFADDALRMLDQPPVPGKGSRNPRVAAALRAGQKAHAQRTYPEGFEKEVALPSGKRMDAYNKETKQVRELKPANPRAVRRGEKQVREYCEECDEVFGPGHTGIVETYTPKKKP